MCHFCLLLMHHHSLINKALFFKSSICSQSHHAYYLNFFLNFFFFFFLNPGEVLNTGFLLRVDVSVSQLSTKFCACDLKMLSVPLQCLTRLSSVVDAPIFNACAAKASFVIQKLELTRLLIIKYQIAHDYTTPIPKIPIPSSFSSNP